MIVCSCRGISCRQIRQEVRDGARTVKEIGFRCRAGRGCGICHQQIRDLILEVLPTVSCQLCEPTTETACPVVGAGDKPAAA